MPTPNHNFNTPPPGHWSRRSLGHAMRENLTDFDTVTQGLQADGTGFQTTLREPAIASLTDNTGGATDGTLTAISGTTADAALNSNMAELNAKLNDILGALRALGLVETA